MLLMTLRGTPTLYYGDEIGLQQAAILPDQVQGPVRKKRSRHRCWSRRMPHPDAMGWHESAGFSDAEPWLPVANNFRDENVDCFRKDKGSLYWLYRRLIDFRRKHVALTEGSYKPLKASGDLLLFCRELREERLLIALNMGSEPIAVSFPDAKIVWACSSIFIFRP